MNCHSFRAVVHDIDEPEYLEAGIRQAALSHLRDCPRCGRRLAAARELACGLRDLARADARKQASHEIEARLLQAFRTQTSRRFRPGRLAWWVAAAAAIALVLGVGLMRRRSPRTAPKSTQSAAGALSPVASEPELPAAGQQTLAKPRQAALSALATTRKKASAPAEISEDVAEFLPLPFADSEMPLGAAEVVRIQLPESAFNQLGLPVRVDSGSQPVTADVVIGDDGVARAIRFVSAIQE